MKIRYINFSKIHVQYRTGKLVPRSFLAIYLNINVLDIPMNKIIYLLVFLLSIPSVLGIETHEITYTLDNDIVKVEHVLASDDSVRLLVPEDAYNFNVIVDKKASDFMLSRTDKHKQLTVPLSAGSHKIGVSYLTASYLEKGKHAYFAGSFQTTQPTDKLSIYLKMPEEALLARPLNALNPPVNPYPASVETTGRQITIKWVEEDVNADDVFSMFVVYEEERGIIWHVVIGVVIILIIGALLYFYIKNKKTVHLKEKAFSHLLEPEQAIVDALLKAKDHSMWQKELQIAAGFTKSKLSRTIRNMEQRDLIKKMPYGSTNRIELIVKK